MADQDKKDQKKNKGPKPEGQSSKGEKQAKAGKKAKPEAAAESAAAEETAKIPAPPARFAIKYRQEVVPALKQELGFTNALAAPRLEKIVISMGLGKFVTAGDKGKMEQAEKELSQIAGQKPVRCKAKKAVSNFKVREGQETGLKVTLRGTRMYEFLDRLISLAIPRVKDFRGLPKDGFDKNGNYNFGFTEQTVFPEVDGAAVTFQQGMNITMVIGNANGAERGRALLKAFGFPFETPESKQ
jgi:large subunit ribosomal protein L5